jgi:hypothetical protein
MSDGKVEVSTQRVDDLARQMLVVNGHLESVVHVLREQGRAVTRVRGTLLESQRVEQEDLTTVQGLFMLMQIK